jgi:uracil phosphoribosyltransferase
MPNVIEIDHPLVKHHLTRLRNQSTSPEQFRLSIGRLAVLLAYEATKDLTTEPVLGVSFWLN